MPVIHLSTIINAPQQIVFNLSRSIDLHAASMQHTNEKAIAGITSGLIEKSETVTWQAKHFFKTRMLKTLITEMQPYEYFKDEMLEGDFKLMQHEHHFSFAAGKTTMNDIFIFEAPYGLLGKMACIFFLTAYMKKLLHQRNLIIKEYAESGKWKSILK